MKIIAEIENLEHAKMPVINQVKVPWWTPSLALAALSSSLLWHVGARGLDAMGELNKFWWYILAGALHLPYFLVLSILSCGIVEHSGYYFRDRSNEKQGRLPSNLPLICVQLPMYHEQAVAKRSIMASCTLDWPADKLEVQVLDDSTDPDIRALVEEACSEMISCGYNCQLMRRTNRSGYKAGALEIGRRQTKAELIAIFDADFVPERDFLKRSVPYFFDDNGVILKKLALVQTQWGHLNHEKSNLTAAQSLWIDAHHTIQMVWRSATWEFVNFTGTAGIWKADAVERVGGWRSTSLVEDCELSVRHLFAGYTTRFVKEIIVPAELPDTYTAYKAQQKRWTQGWVQLQRMHLLFLLTSYKTGFLRKLHLIYHFTISWHWCLWGIWLLVQPYALANGMWFGKLGTSIAVAVYALPCILYLIFFTYVATSETRYTYPTHTFKTVLQRMYRMIPFFFLGAAMLPHQFMSFNEGLFGSMNGEFERTPKMASVSGDRRTPNRNTKVKIHLPYVLAELFFFIYNLAWAAFFALHGKWVNAGFSSVISICVGVIFWFYGDHANRRLFILPSSNSVTEDTLLRFEENSLVPSYGSTVVQPNS